MILTMGLVSAGVFAITEASPSNIARNVLGAFITPEQEASFTAQLGLNRPLWQRYLFWLTGSDWYAGRKIGLPLKRITTRKGFHEWWAVDKDGSLIRWRLQGGNLMAVIRGPGGRVRERPDNGRWRTSPRGGQFFWGLDTHNRAVMWRRGLAKKQWTFKAGVGWRQTGGGAARYLPLKRGILRGDPGVSIRTGRPVGATLFVRLRNSLVLAGIAFVIVMPLAILLGLIAGLKEGSLLDRILSVGGMSLSVVPEFATAIFVILIFSAWLGLVPGATVFFDAAPWQRPAMLILPVLTLTLIELGYVLRITRASMSEVMRSAYIRTAILKGLSQKRIVFKHALKNALLAPITVIMLHVNWLLGGIVVVEVVFGYPGLGRYLLNSALYKDVAALEAGAMALVVVAVGTQLIADVVYTFLNPRIRYT